MQVKAPANAPPSWKERPGVSVGLCLRLSPTLSLLPGGKVSTKCISPGLTKKKMGRVGAKEDFPNNLLHYSIVIFFNDKPVYLKKFF